MKATKVQSQRRVDDLAIFRVQGAEFRHIREYVTEKERVPESPWFLMDGQKPMSDAQLRRYVSRADKQIADDLRSTRRLRLGRHIAQRRHLYLEALAIGDIRTALAVLESEAKMLGLRPAKDGAVGILNVVQAGSAATNGNSPKTIKEIYAKLPTEQVLALMQMLGEERPVVEVVPLEQLTDSADAPR